MHDLILKNVARFIELTAAEKLIFVSMLKVTHVPKKAFLIQEGDHCRYTYFVNKGCLRTYYTDTEGIEHNVQFSIEDWWVGDMYSVLSHKPARYNVVALEDSELLALHRDDQEQLYAKVPKFERFFRNLLQNAFVALQERILSGMSETAEERYLNFRRKYPEMGKRIPQNQIASYLGITPESLSRVRRNLTKKK